MKKLIFLFVYLICSNIYAQDVTPKAVIEKYLEVIGGQVAIAQINDISMEMEGEVQGQKISMLIQKKKPNKFLTSMIVDGMGEVNKIVFDGVKGLTSSMGNDKIIEGDEAKSFLAQSEIIGEVLYLTDISKLQYGGKETIEGKECHVLKVTTQMGEGKEYYDVNTGLKVRQENEVESPMGKMKVIIDYSDYKSVSGIKFPHKLKQDMGMAAFELEMHDLKINNNLDDAVFSVK